LPIKRIINQDTNSDTTNTYKYGEASLVILLGVLNEEKSLHPPDLEQKYSKSQTFKSLSPGRGI
jgi:hypothetical protein